MTGLPPVRLTITLMDEVFIALLNTAIVTVASCTLLFLQISNLESWSLNNKFPHMLLQTILLISFSGDVEQGSALELISASAVVSASETDIDLNDLLHAYLVGIIMNQSFLIIECKTKLFCLGKSLNYLTLLAYSLKIYYNNRNSLY
ncbi:hypothetical protein V7137_04520 [Neobacillus drentensis]